MRKHHPKNERIKRRYLLYLSEAKRMSDSSVDKVAAHIADFETFTGYRDFARFHIEQARRYKEHLRNRESAATGKLLAKATINSRLKALRAFHIWLADQPGYRRNVRYADAEYFNDSANDQRISRATRPKNVATLEQVKRAISLMPHSSEIEMRNRAIVAFALLSGARDNAIASMRIGLIDFEARTIFQDARLVRTKDAKSIFGPFFPVGEDVVSIVLDWVTYLREQKQFGSNDPLFPASKLERNSEGYFEASSVGTSIWSNADPIRNVFRTAFEAAGLPYSNPHTIRDTLTALGEGLCQTPEEFKAWSMSSGHENVLTTLTSYGKVSDQRRIKIMHDLAERQKKIFVRSGEKADADNSAPDAETISQVLAYLQGQTT